MSKRENAATLYIYVKDYVKNLLVAGKYPANSKLPTECELMQELNVGRATVREALAQLEEEGLIYKRQGVGTFVAPADKYAINTFSSFSFTAQSLGFIDKIKVVNEIIGEVDKNNIKYLNRWEEGTKIHGAERIRLISDSPIALDCVYFTEEAFKLAGPDFKFEESYNSKLNAAMSTEINRITTDTIKRKAIPAEADALNLNVGEDVVQVSSWFYVDAVSAEPVAHSTLLISSHLFKYASV